MYIEIIPSYLSNNTGLEPFKCLKAEQNQTGPPFVAVQARSVLFSLGGDCEMPRWRGWRAALIRDVGPTQQQTRVQRIQGRQQGTCQGPRLWISEISVACTLDWGFLCSCFFCLLGLWDWWWHSECHGWKWRKTLSENLKQLKPQQENTTRRSPRGSPRRGHFLKRSKVTRNVIKDDVWMMYVTFGQSWHLAEHHPSIIFSRFHGLMIYVSWFA